MVDPLIYYNTINQDRRKMKLEKYGGFVYNKS